MKTKRVLGIAASTAIAIAVAGCGSSGSDSKSITGAGATFPLPVYQEWAAEAQSTLGLSVNYQGIGSGGGIAQFTAKTVDFGATDSAMKDEEVAAAEAVGTPVHIPTVFGAVTVSYNVPGIDTGMKLDGPTVANIFFGNVKKWDDASIAKLNPGVKLPGTTITVCHRSDESGTTKLFTTWLDATSPEWSSKVGSDKTVQWPTGTGAKGNDGVAACVKQNEGAIGYVEEAFALQNGFTTADLKNSAGKFIAATLDSTSAAGEGLTLPEDLRFSAINAPGETAYPIASATFLLVWQDMCKVGQSEATASAVKQWLDYALGDGQTVAPNLEYAPLPAPVLAAAKAKVAGLTCNGNPLT